MSEFKSDQYFGIEEHDNKITANFKIIDNYPSILRSNGHPFYLLYKSGQNRKDEIASYLKTWRRITRELEPYFRNIRKGSIIKMGDNSEWEITIIKVKNYDIQAIYLKSTFKKNKRYSTLLYCALECFQRGAWKVVKY